MSRDYSADLSGLRDELLSGLRELRKEVKQEGKKITEEIENIAEDIELEPVEIIVDTRSARNELKDLDKQLKTFTRKIKNNLSSLSTSDMREVLSIISKLKDTEKYGEQIQETFGNIAASFIGIGDVSGLDEVVDAFEESASALRNIDWGFGKLHDRNKLIEDQKEILNQLKQIGKLRYVDGRDQSGIDIFATDFDREDYASRFDPDELKTRLDLLERLRENVQDYAKLTRSTKASLFDEDIYKPNNFTYAIDKAISGAQRQIEIYKDFDVPSPDELLQKFYDNIDETIDRNQTSTRLQESLNFYKIAILDGTIELEDAINGFAKDANIDKMYAAFEEMSIDEDLPERFVRLSNDLEAEVRRGESTIEEAIATMSRALSNYREEMAIIADDDLDLDELFESDNLRSYNDLIEECTHLTGELSDAVAKYAKMQKRIYDIAEDSYIDDPIPQDLLDARKQIEDVIDGYFTDNIDDPSLSKTGIITWLRSAADAGLELEKIIDRVAEKFEEASMIEMQQRTESEETTSDLLNAIADALDEERKNVEQAADALVAARKGIGQAYSGDVYHGSKVPLDDVQYDPSKGSGWRNLGAGLYVTPDVELAATYGENIVKKSVALKNVFMLTEDFITNIDDLYAAMNAKKPDNASWDTITAALSSSLNTKSQIKNFTKRMRQMGYDGMYSKGYGFGDKNAEQLVIYDEEYWNHLTTIRASALNELEKFESDKGDGFYGFEVEKYGEKFVEKFKDIEADVRKKLSDGAIDYEQAWVELSNRTSQAWSTMQSNVENVTKTVRTLSAEQHAKMFDGASIKSLLDGYHIGKDGQNEIYDEFNNLGNMIASKMDIDDIEEQKNNIVSLVLKNAKNEVETGLESFFEELTSGKIFYDSKEIAEIGKSTFADIRSTLSSYKLLTPNREKGLRADEHFHGLSDYVQGIIKNAFEREYGSGFNGSKSNILQGIAAVIKNAPSKFIGLSDEEQDDVRIRTAGIVDKVIGNVENLLKIEQKVTEEIVDQNTARKIGAKTTVSQKDIEPILQIAEESTRMIELISSAAGKDAATKFLEGITGETDLQKRVVDYFNEVFGSDNWKFKEGQGAYTLVGDTITAHLINSTKDTIDAVFKLNDGTLELQKNLTRFSKANVEPFNLTDAIESSTKSIDKLKLELGDLSYSGMAKLQESFDAIIDEKSFKAFNAQLKIAQKDIKKIADDTKWVIEQNKQLDSKVRSYKYGSKQLNGTTELEDPDATSMEDGANKTIDGLADHIRTRLKSVAAGTLTDAIKNIIRDDMRVLENEIKVGQLENYTSTTMSASEAEAARKALINQLDTLKAQAEKSNVFDVISESYDKLHSRLTDDKNAEYITTNFSDAINGIRVMRSAKDKAVAESGVTKQEQQYLDHVLNVQEKLYNAKKAYIELEIDEASASDLLVAERKTEELQKQYDASMSLLRNEEDYYVARQRELRLENELRTAIDDQLEAKEKIATNAEKAEELKIAKQTAVEISQYDQIIQSAQEELNTFARWESDIKNVGMLSDETAQRIKNLKNAISDIDDSTDIEKLADEFKSLKSEVTYETTQSKAVKTRMSEIKASLNAQKQELKALYGELDLDIPLGDSAPSPQDIKDSYLDAIHAIEKCTSAIGEQTQEEIASAIASANAVKIKINAYKEVQDQFEAAKLVEEQRTGDDAIRQYYQTLNSAIKQIASLDLKVNNLKLKDDGSGAWSPIIDSLEAQREELLGKVRDTAHKINDAFSDGFMQGDNKIDMPFSSILQILRDEYASQVIQDFFNDFRVQEALTEQSIVSFVSNIQNAQNKAEEFAISLAERLSGVAKSAKTLSDLGRRGSISTDHELYKGGLDRLARFSQYKSTLPSDPTTWSAGQTVTIQKLANDVNEYVATLDKAASKEAEYFARKKQYVNIANMQDYSKMSSEIDKVSNSTSDARNKLESYVDGFANGRAIITGFTTSADGISKIDFSVLEEGTGYLRSFSSEIGQFTNNIYTFESSMNNMTAGTKAVQSVLLSMSQTMSRLNGYGMTIDNNEYVSNLYTKIQSLGNALKNLGTSKDIGDQNNLKNMAVDAERALKKVLALEQAYLKMNDAVADGNAQKVGNVTAGEDPYEKMARIAKEISNEMPGSTIAIGQFNEKTKQLPYVIETADGEVKTFIMTMEKLGGVVTSELKTIDKAKTGWEEFGDSFGGLGKSILKYGASLVGVHDFVRYLRQGFNEVLEIDTAMTELKKVTEETDVAYSNFLESAYKSAQKIGSTMKDFTQATADFARLGYGLEDASMLAEAANVYMNVGDGIEDVGTASESIISTMKAFNVEAKDAIGIVDRFNEVGNNFAIDSVGIGDALQRSAAALAEAGNSIDESIALVTGANTVVQNPEQVGELLPSSIVICC